jgi:hypothetical protein
MMDLPSGGLRAGPPSLPPAPSGGGQGAGWGSALGWLVVPLILLGTCVLDAREPPRALPLEAAGAGAPGWVEGEKFAPRRGVVRFRLSHAGAGEFWVQAAFAGPLYLFRMLGDEWGRLRNQDLVRVRGPYEGAVEKPLGTDWHRLRVRADGAWRVVVEQD